MSIKEKELEQFGAIANNVPKEEWIKPKTDKVILYYFKKQKFQKCMLGCVLLFLTIIGFSVGILQLWTVSIEKLSGSEHDIGKYISGQVTVRTKILETDFGAQNGGNKKWKYFMGIPYGNQNRYVLLLVDEKSYKKYEMLPEIDVEKQVILKNKNGKCEKIEGQVRNLTELPQNLEYWCELFGITEEMIQDEKGVESPEKQEELLEKKMSMVVYIEPKDIIHEKGKIIIIESVCIFMIMEVVLWKKRFVFFETVEKI